MGRRRLEGKKSCPCCIENIPFTRPRICPECRHVFKGKGWEGVDAHWRAKHGDVMRYDKFWETLCEDHRS